MHCNFVDNFLKALLCIYVIYNYIHRSNNCAVLSIRNDYDRYLIWNKSGNVIVYKIVINLMLWKPINNSDAFFHEKETNKMKNKRSKKVGRS